MKITRHKLTDVPFRQAKWQGGAITPEIVILHDTASRLEHGSACAYLADNTARVSVHFVVEIDGSITQLVPTNRAAYHAGRSSYHGREGCNEFSIGIEIVNPGRMTPLPDGAARAWWGEVMVEPQDGEIDVVTTPQHGHGAWMAYPAEQIAAVDALLQCLFRDIPALKDITTHWYVSPGRKVDVNPLFPLEAIRARILGRDDPADVVADAGSSSVDAGEMVAVRAPAGLNLRRWPSFNPNVLLSIPDGTMLPVLRRGTFAGAEWVKTLFAGQEGWVIGRYTTSHY